MRIAVLGTGPVGTTLGTRLVETGHEVRLGSRTTDNATAVAWAAPPGRRRRPGQLRRGRRVGRGASSTPPAGWSRSRRSPPPAPSNLAGKVLLDVSNPLDFSGGFPPAVVQPDGRSLGEQIQAAFPEARVVKTLNTMTADVMVHPRSLPGTHSVFVAGDDADAKALARDLLLGFGWTSDEVVDAGGIAAARGLELYLPLWLSLMGSFGTPDLQRERRPRAERSRLAVRGAGAGPAGWR